MRVLIDLDETRLECEVAHAAPATTLADLVETAGGQRLAPEEQIYVDTAEVRGATPVSELLLLEGSSISRAPWPVRPERSRLERSPLQAARAPASVAEVPQGREMLIGRSPHADLTLPAESASWDHCRLRREEDGLRVLDCGSTNGTLVNGEPVDADGVLVSGNTTVIAGGTVLLVRRSLDETPAPAAGHSAQSDARGDGAVQPSAPPGHAPGRRSAGPSVAARMCRRPVSSATSRYWPLWSWPSRW